MMIAIIILLILIFLLLWRTLTYLKSINKNIVAFAKIVNMKK